MTNCWLSLTSKTFLFHHTDCFWYLYEICNWCCWGKERVGLARLTCLLCKSKMSQVAKISALTIMSEMIQKMLKHSTQKSSLKTNSMLFYNCGAKWPWGACCLTHTHIVYIHKAHFHLHHARHNCSVFTALWCSCSVLETTFYLQQTSFWLFLVWATRLYSPHQGMDKHTSWTPPYSQYGIVDTRQASTCGGKSCWWLEADFSFHRSFRATVCAVSYRWLLQSACPLQNSGGFYFSAIAQKRDTNESSAKGLGMQR